MKPGPYGVVVPWIILGGLAMAGPRPPFFRQTEVFRAGENQVNIYRIPSVIVTQKGTVLAFCEAREAGDQSPTDLALKRSFDQGETWQTMQIAVDGAGPQAIMNPCPVVDRRDGTIFLFCNLFPDGQAQYVPGAVRQWVLTSRDDGASWSSPIDISAQIDESGTWASLCSGPGVAIQTSTGRIVVPLWHWEGGGKMDFVNSAFFSDDHGRTWRSGGRVSGFADENQIIELLDGTLLMNSRVTRDVPERNRRLIAISEDQGLTWSGFRVERSLISPCCQASLLRYTGGKDASAKGRILFSHPNSDTARVDMTVRMSTDEARSWPVSKSVTPGPSAYSCLTILKDGTIGLLYETGKVQAYEGIAFARFNLEWLSGGKDRLE